MLASIYQHAPVLQIAPAVGTGVHMAQLYWRFDYTADEVLLFLWRNLLEKEHYTGAANYKAFTRLSLNSKSVFRCSNKAVGTGWGFAAAQEPSPPKLDLRLPSTSSRQLRREGMFIMMQKCLGETQSQHSVFFFFFFCYCTQG